MAYVERFSCNFKNFEKNKILIFGFRSWVTDPKKLKVLPLFRQHQPKEWSFHINELAVQFELLVETAQKHESA